MGLLPTTSLNFFFLLALTQTIIIAKVFCYTADELDAWNEFKQQFNKTYTIDEEQRRLEVFMDNKRYIESQNVKNTANSFQQGLNQLSDMTTEEIIATRCGFRLIEPDSLNSTNLQPLINSDLINSIYAAYNETQADIENKRKSSSGIKGSLEPTRAWYENILSLPELDYRVRGFVSRVKDQGSCGSCWAFATTGALESQLALRGREQILLSEQNLVDCSRRYGNNGCQGGLMNAALRYIRDRGIMSNRDYPYVGTDNKCAARASKIVMRVRGSFTLPRGNEALLRVALAIAGPIPVAIDAGARSFHSYISGVYNDNVCRNSQRALNHAVLLVGYGTTKHGDDYWILKNSWGSSWGDNGYIKMARNRRNLCGVASFAVLPIL